MAEEVLTSKKLSSQDVVAALEALQKKGADLNPYTLAAELEVDVNVIVVDGEVMETLSNARGDINGIVAAEYNKILKRIEELEKQLQESKSEFEEILEKEKKEARLE